MEILLSNSSSMPIYEQIKEQVKAKILSGELEENEMLPSLRQLAKDLKISVLTSTRAYNELEQDGFITSRHGKGFFVMPSGSNLIREQLIKEVEANLSGSILAAQRAKMSHAELLNLLRLLMDVENKEKVIMSSNQEMIYKQYSSGVNEDDRAVSSRSESLEFHYTKKIISEFINKDSRVIEIGCATGYYALFFADKCKEYVGIDLFPSHIDMLKQKIAENNLENVSCQVGDAIQLKGIDNSSFDVVCCFGPMYHLPPSERELVFDECSRVCKPGGIIAFAYINKIGVYAGACVHDDLREHYPNKNANEFVIRQSVDDIRPDTFFFSMPEEMEATAARHGLVKIRNIGTDFFITMSAVNQMDDEKFEAYMELADEMIKYESCTGMSNHALLVCKKGS